MIFNITFSVAACICLMGIAWHMYLWFKRNTSPDTVQFKANERLRAALRSTFQVFFSGRIITIIKTLVWDIPMQIPLLKAGLFRWLGHMFLFYGFILLVLMHALDEVLTASFFPEYASTLNPFLFLRNFFGGLVLFGILIAVASRIRRGRRFSATHTNDFAAIIFLGIILVSGFALEAVQIFSAPIFDQMVTDYMGTDDPEKIGPLKAYWADHFDIVFPESISTANIDTETGRMLHEENCATCHSRPQAAYISFSLSKVLRSKAQWLNHIRADIWLWYLHFLSCFAGLAYLPFSKFFHLFSVPINWIVTSAGDGLSCENSPNVITRNILGMDACTHCGICSLHCSVEPIYRLKGNPTILPSEKLIAVKGLFESRHLEMEFLDTLSQGSFICTECLRCTALCPSGIPLQDLWKKSKQALVEKGYPDAHRWMLNYTADEWANKLENAEIKTTKEKTANSFRYNIYPPDAFADCVQCSICTNVCPIVTAGKGIPMPDTTPQQVMNLLRLGLTDLAIGSRMVWDCVTCYMCQEHCPQNIRVTDILYELRNMAIQRFQPVRFLPVPDSGINQPENE